MNPVLQFPPPPLPYLSPYRSPYCMGHVDVMHGLARVLTSSMHGPA